MRTHAIVILLVTSVTSACINGEGDGGAPPVGSLQQQATTIGGNKYHFVKIDYPGFYSYNAPIGINKYRELAGFYDDNRGYKHGYTWRNNVFTALDVPGATQTWATAINDSGDVNGTYFDSQGFQHGFLYRNGQFTTIDVPGAAQSTLVPFEFGPGLGTAGFGMNNAGAMVGEYADTQVQSHGWLRSGGQFTILEVPSADLKPGGGTSAIGINNSLDIVGKYSRLLPPMFGGFLWRAGQYTKFDHPQAGGLLGTHPNGINDSGDIVGVYSDITVLLHGFLYSQGKYSKVDYPGAVQSECHAINNHGDITGLYFDHLGRRHGFVAFRL